MAYQSQDIVHRSAINGFTPAPQARNHQQEVTKLIDVTTCIGYKTYQVTYSEWNDIRDEVGHNIGVYDNPADLTAKSWTVIYFSEVEQNDKLEWPVRKDGYMHCTNPGCLKACPSEDVIIQYANGIVDFQSEQCIGCGYRIAGCPFDVSRLNPEGNRVYKYTLCVDRVTAGQEPAYVKTYPTGTIHLGSREDVRTLAGERVAELKARDYNNAGLYGPADVGGTHIMYVLCHVDKSNLYHGPPENPEISQTVRLWKGIQEPLVATDFATTFAVSIFHYVGAGLNRAEEKKDNLHEGKDGVRK